MIRKKNQYYFNHLNSGQFSTFLYFLSNSCFARKNKRNICDKILPFETKL